MKKIQTLMLILIFIATSFFLKTDVCAAWGDDDDVGGSGTVMTEDIELWEYKQAIDESYPKFGYEDVDYIKSNRGIRYPAWKIGANVPGFIHTVDMSSRAESIMQFGYTQTIEASDGAKKYGADGQVPSVMLYLHRVTNNMELYKASRIDWYYESNDCMGRDTIGCEQPTGTKSIVNNIGGYRAPSSQLVYSSVPHVMGYEGTSASKFVTGVMDDVNEAPVPVYLSEGNTGLFSVNMDRQSDPENIDNYLKGEFPLNDALTSEEVEENGSYGYSPFSFETPNGETISIDKRIGLEDAIKSMKGPQFVGSVEIALSEAITLRNSTYSFMSSMNNNGNYYRYTDACNVGSNGGFTTYGVMNINSRSATTDYYAYGSTVGVNSESIQANISRLKIRSSADGNAFNSQTRCVDSNPQNQNFKNWTVPVVRVGYNPKPGKQFNYWNDTVPYSFTIDGKTYYGFKIVPVSKSGETKGFSTMWAGVSNYENTDEFGVWRQTGYSLINKMVGTYLPRDSANYNTVVGQKESGYAGESNSGPRLERFPWTVTAGRNYASSPQQSKNFLNGYITKKQNGVVNSAYSQAYENGLISFANAVRTMPDFLLRTVVLETSTNSGSQFTSDCGNGTPFKDWKSIDGSDVVLNGTTTNYTCTNYPSLNTINSSKHIGLIAQTLCAEIGGSRDACEPTTSSLFSSTLVFNPSTNKYPNSWAAIQAALNQRGPDSNTTYWEDLAYVYYQYMALVQLPDQYSMGIAFATRDNSAYYTYEAVLDSDQSNVFILNEETRLGDQVTGRVNETGNPVGTPAVDILGDDYGSKYGSEIFAIDTKTGNVFSQEKEQTCPTGYTKDGSDCVRTLKKAFDKSCPTGLKYNSTSKMCESLYTRTPTCPANHELVGSFCIQESELRCRTGSEYWIGERVCFEQKMFECLSLDADGVEKLYHSYYCYAPSGGSVSSYCDFDIIGGRCGTKTLPTCDSGRFDTNTGKCISKVSPTCPSGFSFRNGTCVQNTSTSVKPQLCTDGYTEGATYCYKESIIPMEDVLNDSSITGGKPEYSKVELNKTYVLRNYVAYQPSIERGFMYLNGDESEAGSVRSGTFPHMEARFYLYADTYDPTGLCRDSDKTNCATPIPSSAKNSTVLNDGIPASNLENKRIIASFPIGDAGGEDTQAYLWAEYTPGETVTESNFSPRYSKVDVLFKFEEKRFCYYNKPSSSESFMIADDEFTCKPYEDVDGSVIIMKGGSPTINMATDGTGKKKVNSLGIQTYVLPPQNIGAAGDKKAFNVADNNIPGDDTASIITGFTTTPIGDTYIDRIEMYDEDNIKIFAADAMTLDRCDNGFKITKGASATFTDSFDGLSYDRGSSDGAIECNPYNDKKIYNLDVSKNYYFKLYTKYIDAGLTGIASDKAATVSYQALDLKHSGNFGAVAILNKITSSASTDPATTYTVRTGGVVSNKQMDVKPNSLGDFDIFMNGLFANKTSTALSKTTLPNLKTHLNPSKTVYDPMAALTLPAAALSKLGVTNGQADFYVSAEMVNDNAYATWDYFPFSYEIGANLDNAVNLVLKCYRNGALEDVTTKDGTCTYVDNAVYNSCKLYAVIERVAGNGDTTTNIKVATSTDRDVPVNVEGRGTKYSAGSTARLNENVEKIEIYIKDINPLTTKELYGEALYQPKENGNYPDTNVANDKTDECWMFSPVDYSVEGLQLEPTSVTPDLDASGNILYRNKPVTITGKYSITKVYDKGSNKNIDIKYVLSDGGGATYACRNANPTSHIGGMIEGTKDEIDFSINCDFDFSRLPPGNNVKLEIWINGGKTSSHRFLETNYDNNVTFKDIFTVKPCVGKDCYTCDNSKCSNTNNWTVNFQTMYEFQRSIIEKQTTTQAYMKWTDWRIGNVANVPYGPYVRSGDAADRTYASPITRGNTNRAPNDYMAYRNSYRIYTKMCTDYRNGNADCWRYENNVSHKITYYKMSQAKTKVYTTRPVLRSAMGGRCSGTTQRFSGYTWGDRNSGQSGSSHTLAPTSYTTGGTRNWSTCHGYSGSDGTYECSIISDWYGVGICRSSPEIYTTNAYSGGKPPDYIPAENFLNYDVTDNAGMSVTTKTDRVTLPEQASHNKQGGAHAGWVSTTHVADECINERYQDVYYKCESDFIYLGPSGGASVTTATNARCSASRNNIRRCEWLDYNNAPQNDWWPIEERTCYRIHYDFVCPEYYEGGDIQCDNYDGSRCVDLKSSSFRCKYEKDYVNTRITCSSHKECDEKEVPNGKDKYGNIKYKTVRYNCYTCYNQRESSSESGWSLYSPDNDNHMSSCSSGSSSSAGYKYIAQRILSCDSGIDISNGQACYEVGEEYLVRNNLRCTNWRTVTYQEVKYYTTNTPTLDFTSRTYETPKSIWEYTCTDTSLTIAYPGQTVRTNYNESIAINGRIKTERSGGWIPINSLSNVKEANPRGGEWFELEFTTIYNTNRGQRPSPAPLLNDYYNNYNNIGLNQGYSTYPAASYDHHGRHSTPVNSSLSEMYGRDVVNNEDYGYCDARPQEPYGCAYSGWQFSPITRNDATNIQGHTGSDWKTTKNNGQGVCYFGPDNNAVWQKKVFGDDVLTAVEVCPGNVSDCTPATSIISGKMEVQSSACTRWEGGLCTQYTKVFKPQRTKDATGKWHQGFFVPVDFKAQTVTIQASTSMFTAVGKFEQTLLGTNKSNAISNAFYGGQAIKPLCKCNTYPIILKDGEVSWATSEWDVQ